MNFDGTSRKLKIDLNTYFQINMPNINRDSQVTIGKTRPVKKPIAGKSRK